MYQSLIFQLAQCAPRRIAMVMLALLCAVPLGSALVPQASAAPAVEFNFDASFEGLAGSGQIPLGTGLVRVGWFSGLTPAQVQTAAQNGDFTSLNTAFREVYAFTELNDFGTGLPFKTTTLVAANDNTALGAYKDATNGAAGKRIYAWILNDPAGLAGSPSQMGIVTSDIVFPAANDTVGGTDFGTTFATDSFVTSLNPLLGSVAAVAVGGQVDTNGGSPADGVGLNGGDKAFVLGITASTATIRLESAAFEGSETAGAIDVVIKREGKTSSTVSVKLNTANGSASAGLDYTGITDQTVTFNNGETSKTIPVTIASRPGFQADRDFTATISDPSPESDAELGAPTSATVTIKENELPNFGQFNFASATYNVGEGGASVTITVDRTGGDGTVSVSYGLQAGGTAVTPDDFTINGASLTFVPGETSKTFTVSIQDDSTFEGDETFHLVLSNPTGGATLGAATQTVVTITENDEPPAAGSIQFSSATYNVVEGNTNATITVTRTGGTGGEVKVAYQTTASGTAAEGQDFTAASGTLTFPDASSASQQFTVPIIDDVNFEGNETIGLSISISEGTAALGQPNTAVLTITENDQPGNFRFSTATPQVQENGGPAVITVERTSGSDGTATVNYSSTNGTATAGMDYTAANGTLTFTNGETSKTFNVPITDDQAFEGNETVNLALAAPSTGSSLASPSAATLTIVENEQPQNGKLSFASTQFEVQENGGTATIMVVRTQGSDGTVTVNYATANGTATQPDDYTAAAGTLTFNQGELSKSFTVPITNDTVIEGDETVAVSLNTPTGGAAIISPASAVLNIRNDDLPVTFRFAQAVYNTVEPGSVTVTIERANGLDQTATVKYATSNGTASSGKDYTTRSGTLSFGPDETSKTITIPILDDTAGEGEENFFVQLSNAAIAGIQQATITTKDKKGKKTTVLVGPVLAQIGTPGKAEVRIAENETVYRPDAQAKASSSFLGNNVYNTTGDSQIAVANIARGKKATFTVRVQNDGNFTDSFTLLGALQTTAQNASRFSVVFKKGSTNITSQVQAGTYLIPNVGAGSSVDITVEISSTSSAPVMSGASALVTAKSVKNTSLSDAARPTVLVTK